MSDDRDVSTLRQFLNEVDRSGDVRVERQLDVSVAIEDDRVVLEADDEVAGPEAVGDEVTIRAEADSGGAHWIAEAVWTDSDRLAIEGIRSHESGEESLHYWRSSYRVSLPDRTEVELTGPSLETSPSATPVDLSTDGIGLYVDQEASFEVGEEVEVDLQIGETFEEAIGGRVAFTESSDEENRVRLGVEFRQLDPEVEARLQSVLNQLMLVSADEMAE